jgi:hypothetical protein
MKLNHALNACGAEKMSPTTLGKTLKGMCSAMPAIGTRIETGTPTAVTQTKCEEIIEIISLTGGDTVSYDNGTRVTKDVIHFEVDQEVVLTKVILTYRKDPPIYARDIVRHRIEDEETYDNQLVSLGSSCKHMPSQSPQQLSR